MKAYVSELPECCDECPCCNHDVDYGSCCNLGAYDYEEWHQTDSKHNKCPLQSLADHDKQVRKELLQEIDYSALIKMSKKPDDLFYKDAIYESFKERLEQIQGEDKQGENI